MYAFQVVIHITSSNCECANPISDVFSFPWSYFFHKKISKILSTFYCHNVEAIFLYAHNNDTLDIYNNIFFNEKGMISSPIFCVSLGI